VKNTEDEEPQFGQCPVCGAITGSAPGQQTGAHQKPDGSRETCSGGVAQ
jgi:hypothetical protein